MIVRVHLFALARQLAGSAFIDCQLDPPATVGVLRKKLAERHPLLGTMMVAVNAEYATDADVLPADAEVAILPPVSGG